MALPYTFQWGLLGLVGGALFSVALATVRGRRTLGELRPAWAGLWGGLAGLLVYMGWLGIAVAFQGLVLSSWSQEIGQIAMGALIGGGIGAASAGGTIMLAQGGAKEIESSDPDQLLTSHR